MPEYKNVMIFGEVAGGALSAITAELLGCGRNLADDLGEELSVVLAACRAGNPAQEAVSLGADRVYVVNDPLLEDGRTDAAVAVMEKLINRERPRILLLGQTDEGRDLACRLAFRLGTAATLDCVRLSIDSKSKLLLQTKPVYGGNAFAVYACKSYPQIAAVRPKVMTPSEHDAARRGEIVEMEAGLDPSIIRTRTLKKAKEEAEGVNLEEAGIVVAGGRGMGGHEGFKLLEELAGLLNGAVGATRSSCDHGWAPYRIQIGITGKIISPDLYIAVGISGAGQHLTGVAGARNIVAVNKDAGANIFKAARFGIVGDWQRTLPAFIAKVRELVSKR